MTDATANNLQRLHDLLSEQATAGLSDSDQLELQQLLVENATLQREGYELAAAAVDLALAPPGGTPLPERVRRNALMKSTMEAEPEAEIEPVVYNLAEEKTLAPRRVVGTAISTTLDVEPAPPAPPLPPEPAGKMMNWAIALAIIGVAYLTYSAGKSSSSKRDGASTAPIVTEAALSSCDQLKGDSDAMTMSWTADEPTVAGVSGEVRFSAKLQQGCVTLVGLPLMNPVEKVYQLWVLDAGREGPPVDCGVFEVTDPKNATLQFAFTPKLKVMKPVVFAITREAPGGVVTSKDQPIIVAKMGA